MPSLNHGRKFPKGNFSSRGRVVIPALFVVFMGALSIIAAVFAAIWWFIASQREDTAETHAERARRWREQMRSMSRR